MNLSDVTVVGHGHALRSGRLTVREATRSSLAEIERRQAELNAFVARDDSSTLRAAEHLDEELSRGVDRGPLHGVPVAVKDNIAVQGTVMRAGSRFLRQPALADSAIVKHLRAAGAVILGRTRMHEIAMGATGLNPHDGGARNPADPTRVPGGSSSGSAAAVAAGLCAIALGTDTGGSVRIPAAFCGVVGFKPTFGTLSVEGILPVSPALDHVGILGRSVADVVAAFGEIGGCLSWPADHDLRLRVGVLAAALDNVDAAVAKAFERSLASWERRGATLTEVRLADNDELLRVSWTIIFRDAFKVHAHAFQNEPASFAPDVRERLALGAEISVEAYDQALAAVEQLRVVVRGWFQQVDFLVSPTVPIVGPRIADVRASVLPILSQNTRLHNLAGIPAITIPIVSTGPAVGFQIAGAPGADADLLAAGQALETVFSGRA